MGGVVSNQGKKQVSSSAAVGGWGALGLEGGEGLDACETWWGLSVKEPSVLPLQASSARLMPPPQVGSGCAESRPSEQSLDFSHHPGFWFGKTWIVLVTVTLSPGPAVQR